MRYLLDASALLPLATKLGKALIAKASREWLATTDLAIYEAYNSLWKLCKLLKSISLEDGTETATLLRALMDREVIHLIAIGELELAPTFKMACDEGLTFYDASYLMAAKRQSAVLVTQDEKLRKSAEGHVEVMNSTTLEHRLISV